MADNNADKEIAAFIVPSHNEQERIATFLQAFQPEVEAGRYRVIIVANGCSDNTAEIARGFPGVVVYETDVASQLEGYNAGDDLADDIYPRFYCDADVVMSPKEIALLVKTASREEPVAVAPSVVLDWSQSSWPVKAYYRMRDRFPGHKSWGMHSVSGKGFFGTNQAGRARFNRFPNLIAGDYFFDEHFLIEERIIVAEAVSVTRVAKDLAGLIRVRTRVTIGNAEMTAFLSAKTFPAPLHFSRAPRPPRSVRTRRRLSKIRHDHWWLNVAGLKAIPDGLCYWFVERAVQANVAMKTKSKQSGIKYR
jgi:glycosyltransferase involved in cell wall biosynthesis